ncbi:MAG: hypothetical protein AzoDbin1_04623 [Azoarcus sp.]|nr:hypothetical protein [Azoarcus sp.]
MHPMSAIRPRNKAGSQKRPALDLRALIRLDPMDRIKVLRAGIESVALVEIATAVGRSMPELIDLLQLAGYSAVAAPRKGSRLSTEQSERVLAFLRLIEAADDMVRTTSQHTPFDAARWVGDWLASPCPALGDALPASPTRSRDSGCSSSCWRRCCPAPTPSVRPTIATACSVVAPLRPIVWFVVPRCRPRRPKVVAFLP